VTDRRYQRHIEQAIAWGRQKMQRETAKSMQKAIRAEAGARNEFVKCVVDGQVEIKASPLKKCICVTCGKEMLWNHKGCHAGHFIPGRRPSILFGLKTKDGLIEFGINPQCFTCNGPKGGNVSAYRQYMLATADEEICEELWWQHNNVSKTWSIEELVPMRIGYLDRIRSAEKAMT